MTEFIMHTFIYRRYFKIMSTGKRFSINSIKNLPLLFLVSAATACMFAFIGMPAEENSLKQQVLDYSLKIADVYRGSAGDKALFLKDNFCQNGELEQVALQATDDAEELYLVENLGRDCAVIIDYLLNEV